MYAFSTRCDLPLFSSLFRAKVRTRILSTTFGAIFVSNRRPVNLTKKVNLLSPQSILFLFPDSLSPRGFRHLLLLSPFPSVPSLPHHSAPTSARRKPLASHLVSRLLGTMRWAPCSALAGSSARDRHPASTNENSPEFSQKRKLEGVQAQFYAAAIRQCKMKKKSSFIRSSGEIEGLSTPLLRASVRRI